MLDSQIEAIVIEIDEEESRANTKKMMIS